MTDEQEAIRLLKQYGIDVFGLIADVQRLSAQVQKLTQERNHYQRQYAELAERLEIKRFILLRRKDDTCEPYQVPAKHHLSRDGSTPVCRVGRFEPSKYDAVEVYDLPNEGVCARCRKAYFLPEPQPKLFNRVNEHNESFWQSLTPDQDPSRDTYVYVFKAEGRELYKIGISNRPQKRLNTLRSSSGGALRAIYVSLPCTREEAHAVEQDTHWRFRRERRDGEWFELSPSQVRMVKGFISEEVDKVKAKRSRKKAS